MSNLVNSLVNALEPKPQRKKGKRRSGNNVVVVQQPPKQPRQKKPRKKRGKKKNMANVNSSGLNMPRGVASVQARTEPSVGKTVTGNDHIGSIPVQGKPAGTVLLEFLVEPRSVARLAREAETMQRIVWEHFSLSVKSRSGTNLNGGYLVAFVADPDDVLPDTDRVKYLAANRNYNATNFFSSCTVPGNHKKELLYTNKSQVPLQQGSSELRLYSPGKYYVIVETPAAGDDNAQLSFYFNYRVHLSMETLLPPDPSTTAITYTVPPQGLGPKAVPFIGTTTASSSPVGLLSENLVNVQTDGLSDIPLPEPFYSSPGLWMTDTPIPFRALITGIQEPTATDLVAYGLDILGQTFKELVPVDKNGESFFPTFFPDMRVILTPIGATFTLSQRNARTLAIEPVRIPDDRSGLTKMPDGTLRSATILDPALFRDMAKSKHMDSVVDRLAKMTIIERSLARQDDKDIDWYLTNLTDSSKFRCPSCNGVRCVRPGSLGFGYCYRCFIDFDLVTGHTVYH